MVTRPPDAGRRSGRALTALAAALAAVAVCLGGAVQAGRLGSVAVFPVENLGQHAVHGDALRDALLRTLASANVQVLPDAALAEFMTRHRVRYAAGVDADTGAALRQETGVDAVLIPTIEGALDAFPSQFCAMARLVTVSDVPTVVWADDVGMAADDAPGLFELGVIRNPETLRARAFDRLSRSLSAYVQSAPLPSAKRASKFRPTSVYRGLTLAPGRTYSVAVLPFYNRSEHRTAGEIVAALFARHLSAHTAFRVFDPGVTRQQLLNMRIVMDGGVSLTDADGVASLISADFVVAGRVLDYRDAESGSPTPHVEFSTMLFDHATRRVVFSARSDNSGRDGVRFFDIGTSKTAHGMATQMVGTVVDAIAGEPK